MAISLKSLKSLGRFFQRDKNENGDSQLTVAFSLPFLIACVALLLCAIGWSFFIGFMVGRGQNPETRINAITGGLLSGSENSSPDTLPPLQEDNQPATETAPTPVSAARFTVSTDVPPHPFTRPEGASEKAWQPPAPPRKEKPQKPKPTDTNRYEYTFQTAAFKNAQEADNLKKKLSSGGLRCETRKAGRVFLVIVNIRGTEADVEKFRQKLAAYRLGQPLQLAKKEIGQKSGKSK